MDIWKDILPSIYHTKVDILEDEKDYNAFLINKSVSLHVDSIFHAAEMSRCSNLSARQQYRYYLTALRSKKRPYVAWPKSVKNKELEAIKAYYNISNQKAFEYRQILNDEQVEQIIQKMEDVGRLNIR